MSANLEEGPSSMTLTAPGWPILLPQEARLGDSCLSCPVPPLPR